MTKTYFKVVYATYDKVSEDWTYKTREEAEKEVERLEKYATSEEEAYVEEVKLTEKEYHEKYEKY